MIQIFDQNSQGHLIRQLKENNLYGDFILAIKKIIKGLDKNYSKHYCNNCFKTTSVTSVTSILTQFLWTSSPQGYYFWRDEFNRIKRK